MGAARLSAGQKEDRTEKQPPPLRLEVAWELMEWEGVPLVPLVPLVPVVVEWLCTEALCGL